MAYSPTQIAQIAERVTKEIRHMDVITHDPEGQRILRLVISACQECYRLGMPNANGKSTHVTTDKDIQFRVEGVGEVKGAKVVQEAQPAPQFGICAICSSLHDPRGIYDHAPEPLRKTG